MSGAPEAPDGPRLHAGWSTPAPDAEQVLVRMVRPGGRWRAERYEIGYHPDGRRAPAAWLRETRLTDIPGATHTTDLHDLRVLLREAREVDEGAWVAWPVHRRR